MFLLQSDQLLILAEQRLIFVAQASPALPLQGGDDAGGDQQERGKKERKLRRAHRAQGQLFAAVGLRTKVIGICMLVATDCPFN